MAVGRSALQALVAVSAALGWAPWPLMPMEGLVRGAPNPVPQQDGPTELLVFFDPDANHQAIASITGSFNRFLRTESSNISFQAVQNREQLDSLLEQPRVVLAFVSVAYLRERKQHRLVPKLVPAKNGDVSIRKVLYHVGKAQPGNLSGLRIAASAPHRDPSQASAEILSNLRRLGLLVKGSIAIPVAKDIDALLALSFGQVDAALVTGASVSVLRRINPSAVKTFKALLETSLVRPPLCVVEGRLSSERAHRLIRDLRNMDQNPDGRRAMLSLGFTEWMDFEEGLLK